MFHVNKARTPYNVSHETYEKLKNVSCETLQYDAAADIMLK